MLGIIVVKLHDDFDFNNAKANVQIQQGNKQIYRNHMKIRLCPLKEKAITSGDHLFQTIDTAWVEGYNACLETIIGDTK